jgi:hypothetical protein
LDLQIILKGLQVLKVLQVLLLRVHKELRGLKDSLVL